MLLHGFLLSVFNNFICRVSENCSFLLILILSRLQPMPGQETLLSPPKWTETGLGESRAGGRLRLCHRGGSANAGYSAPVQSEFPCNTSLRPALSKLLAHQIRQRAFHAIRRGLLWNAVVASHCVVPFFAWHTTAGSSGLRLLIWTPPTHWLDLERYSSQHLRCNETSRARTDSNSSSAARSLHSRCISSGRCNVSSA